MGMPTPEEIEAIDLITEHVADAIMWSRGPHDFVRRDAPRPRTPLLRLVCDNQEANDSTKRLLRLAEKLQSKATDFDQFATGSESQTVAERLRDAAELSRKLGVIIKSHLDRNGSRKRIS